MKEYPGRVHITAVLVNYTTPTGRQHKGVATHWLRWMVPEGDTQPEIPIFVRRSQFKLPPVPSKPILMIGEWDILWYWAPLTPKSIQARERVWHPSGDLFKSESI